MRDINADLLMDKLSSDGLLAAHDQELILTGQSMHQRNCLLLEHVRHMEMQAIMKFCEFVQGSSPQVGLQLIKGNYAHTILSIYIATYNTAVVASKYLF